jgi:nucleotide-binding universal stress UspA family protein
MAYRKILVPLTGGQRDTRVLNAAFDIGKAFGSHVAALFVRPDPAEVVPYLGEGVSAGVMQEIMDASRAATKRAYEVARATFHDATVRVGAPVGLNAQAGLGATLQMREGFFDDVITAEARLSDLVVFDSPADAKEASLQPGMEAALMHGRTPLLLVPHRDAAVVGTKVAIGWDGGAAAAHAIAASIPLLARAQSVEIINVNTGPIDTIQMDRLRDYLRLHGIAAVEHGINPGGQTTASALIDGATRSGAGLLVIGGYGHSRLRELVLGGVTRHVFANATLPVFMAH